MGSNEKAETRGMDQFGGDMKKITMLVQPWEAMGCASTMDYEQTFWKGALRRGVEDGRRRVRKSSAMLDDRGVTNAVDHLGTFRSRNPIRICGNRRWVSPHNEVVIGRSQFRL